MRIHYLQHVPFEGLGCIAEWIGLHGHALTATKFFEADHRLPLPQDIDMLIVMGGPMGVYDEVEHPWLMREKAFIQDCIHEGKKVLGICLGAQLATVCLGAFVTAARNKEIGWFPVMPTDECKNLDWCWQLFGTSPVVFHWHGDKFDIPYGALDLLRSEGNTNQAFLYQGRVMGLQFHLEVTEASVEEMIRHGAEELVPPAPDRTGSEAPALGRFIQTADAMVANKAHISANNQLMYRILDYFAAT